MSARAARMCTFDRYELLMIIRNTNRCEVTTILTDTEERAIIIHFLFTVRDITGTNGG
jgi:hypothetical protein